MIAPKAPKKFPSHFFQAPGHLLEYIPGFKLCDLTDALPDRSPAVWREIVDKMVAATHELLAAGIVHGVSVLHGESVLGQVLVRESPAGSEEGKDTAGDAYQPFLIGFEFSHLRWTTSYLQWARAERSRDAETERERYKFLAWDNHGVITIAPSVVRKIWEKTGLDIGIPPLKGWDLLHTLPCPHKGKVSGTLRGRL